MADGSGPKNKAALLIALGGKPKGMGIDKSDDMASEGDTDDAVPAGDDMKRAAAEDALAAFKTGDVDALSLALSDFVRACKSEDY